MPERYHVHTVPTPPAFSRVGKYGTADWREDCSRCKNCVKLRCLYNVYSSESRYNRDPAQPLSPLYECKSCLSCVQGCTKGLLSLTINPEYLALGNEYWKPDILSTTWDQAESGRVPVSGAGYRGRFSGPGFDSMWTDMSEIVRPTRDGIHGREYISTAVDLGSKPMRLEFDADGAVKNEARIVELQLPVLLDAAPWGDPSDDVLRARVKAARSLQTLAIVPARQLGLVDKELRASVAALFDGTEALPAREDLAGIRVAEVADGPGCLSFAKKLMAIDPALLVAARIALRPDSGQRVLALREGGVTIIHLCADSKGRETASARPGFIKEALREIHGLLVDQGARDEVTLIASGGIALAEHIAKAVICGADLVAVDISLLVALGCRVCDGGHGAGCPVKLREAGRDYAVQRMINLMGAWHSQLLEVLGAMGIREVRRLRGEVGRAMFLEDLEREAFKDLVRSA